MLEEILLNMHKQKSLAMNTVLYSIKTLSNILFPLVTFPYISRILSPVGLGSFSFSSSIISYFLLISALGISTLGINEGSKLKSEKSEFNSFAQTLFTLNILSASVSFVLCVGSIYLVPEFESSKQILLILSLSIPFSAIGTEWVFNIYEDYIYVTIRSIIFQLLSLLLLITFVRSKSDVYIYAWITVFSSISTNIMNFSRSRRYFIHKLYFNNEVRRYFKITLILFASSVASQVYINSDITMLGIFKNDYSVGVYSAATKIYNVLRSVLSAFIAVLTPRLAFFFSKNRKKYNYYLREYLTIYFFVIFPVSVGIFTLSNYFIILLCGVKYIEANSSLKMLMIALNFSLLGSYIANEILIISGNESKILKCTIIGAIVNFFLNIILIPIYSYNGAAASTIVSECLVLIFQYRYCSKIVQNIFSVFSFIKIIISGSCIFLYCFVIINLHLSFIYTIIICILGSIIIYILMIFIVKQTEVINLLKNKKNEWRN